MKESRGMGKMFPVPSGYLKKAIHGALFHVLSVLYEYWCRKAQSGSAHRQDTVFIQTQLKSISFEDRAQQMKIEDSFYVDYG